MDGFILLFYVKKHIKGIMLFILFSLIFFITFYLYQLPTEAVFYAAMLCSVLGILVIIPDFIKYYRKHKLLQKLKKYIAINNEDMPEPKDIIEKDYTELIQILFEEKALVESSADNSSKEMVDYYTMWVHQIKTPIAALRLLLQSGQANSNSEGLPEQLAELFKIEQYVEMVLSYLRMESMSSDLLLKRYSLDSIIKQAVRKYASIFINKKIQLKFNEINTQILTDEKWLLFVIEQILSNALKYTAEGGCISIYMEEGSKQTLIIEDTGIGIEPEDVPRVFEKGFTGYNGRSDKKSTGIGLYLCKRIVTKLSHTIELESMVGNGTRVKIGLDSADKVFE